MSMKIRSSNLLLWHLSTHRCPLSSISFFRPLLSTSSSPSSSEPLLSTSSSPPTSPPVPLLDFDESSFYGPVLRYSMAQISMVSLGPWQLRCELNEANNLVITASLPSFFQAFKLQKLPHCSLVVVSPCARVNSSTPSTYSPPEPLSFGSFPVELLSHITSFLNRKAVLRLGAVNQQWKQVCDSDWQWKTRFVKAYGTFPLLEMSWKQRFSLVHRSNLYNGLKLPRAHDCFAYCSGSLQLYDYYASNRVQPHYFHNPEFLQEACRWGFLNLAQRIVASSPSLLSSLSKEGTDSPLHLAAHSGHLELVEWMAGAAPEMIDRMSRDHSTPLMVAIQTRHFSVADALIRLGAALHSNTWVRTLLEVDGVVGKDTRRLEYVLKVMKENLSLTEQQEFLNKSQGCLLTCVANHIQTAMRMLIDAGMDVTYKHKDGHNLLSYAIWQYSPKEQPEPEKFMEMLKMLLNAVPLPQRKEYMNDERYIPIIIMAIQGTARKDAREVPRAIQGEEMIQWLIENGASVTEVFDQGMTPIQFARTVGASKAVIELLRAAVAKEKENKKRKSVEEEDTSPQTHKKRKK